MHRRCITVILMDSSRLDENGKYQHYSTDIKELIFEESVLEMWHLCEKESERLLLSLLWFSGARPSEIIELTRKDIEWGLTQGGTNYFAMRLKTKKLGNNTEEFKITERTLQSTRPMGKDANLFIECIIKWCKRLLPEEQLLAPAGWTSTRSINRIMHKIAGRIGKEWCPYHWRHSTMTHLAASGMSIAELMHWKGSTDAGSVSWYVHARPSFIAIENIRKARGASIAGGTKYG